MSESGRKISAEDRRAYIGYAVLLIATAVLLSAIIYSALYEEGFSISHSVEYFLITLSVSIVALLALTYLVDTPVGRTRGIIRNVCLTAVVAMVVFTMTSVYAVEYDVDVKYPVMMIYVIPMIIVCGMVIGLRYAYLYTAVMFILLRIWYPLSSISFLFFVIGTVTVAFSVEWYLLRGYKQVIRYTCTVLVTLLTYVGFKLSDFGTLCTDLQFAMYYVLPVTLTVAIVMIVHMMLMRISTMKEDYMVERQNIRMSKEIQESVMASKQYSDDDLTFSADMRTSSDIGGDFYDTFTNNSGLRFFIIGDVSGKNMPAAMSMMETMAFAEAASMDVNSPAEVISTVNRLFCRVNRAEQFVTMWAGAYDSDTCTLYHSNAGHMFPMFRHDGGFSELKEERGPAVGFDDSSEYDVNITRISEGDGLFLYTDGVTEAFSPSGEEFGKERLIRTLNSCGDPIIGGVFSEVIGFTEGSHLSDDLTAVSVSFTECGIDSEIFTSDTNRLYDVQDFIGQRMEAVGFDNVSVMRAQMTSEEIFINICRYAYFGEIGDVEVMCRRISGGMAISFIDSGIPFNPLSKNDPDIDEQFDKREGGFGIYLTKKMCDSVSYRYVCGKNILTMRFLRKEKE